MREMLCFCPELGECPGTQLLWGISSRLAPGAQVSDCLSLSSSCSISSWLAPFSWPFPSLPYPSVETPADESLNTLFAVKEEQLGDLIPAYAFIWPEVGGIFQLLGTLQINVKQTGILPLALLENTWAFTSLGPSPASERMIDIIRSISYLCPTTSRYQLFYFAYENR